MVKKTIKVVSLEDVKPLEETPEIQQPEHDERTQIKQAIDMNEQQQERAEQTDDRAFELKPLTMVFVLHRFDGFD